jgi:hypothetical protein
VPPRLQPPKPPPPPPHRRLRRLHDHLDTTATTAADAPAAAATTLSPRPPLHSFHLLHRRFSHTIPSGSGEVQLHPSSHPTKQPHPSIPREITFLPFHLTSSDGTKCGTSRYRTLTAIRSGRSNSQDLGTSRYRPSCLDGRKTLMLGIGVVFNKDLLCILGINIGRPHVIKGRQFNTLRRIATLLLSLFRRVLAFELGCIRFDLRRRGKSCHGGLRSWD